jgi:hypothetical protein
MRRTRGEGGLRLGAEAALFADGFPVLFAEDLCVLFEVGRLVVFAEGFDCVWLVAELSVPC